VSAASDSSVSVPATVLERIVQSTREEIERRKRELSQRELEAQPLRGLGERRLREALTAPGVGVIAEFKRRSPSAGTLRRAPDVTEMASAYARGGASAMSVLTEGPNFGGSLEDLRAARQACDLPLLRKDFIVDPYQLHEARAAGADAVLLIVAALDREELAGLHGEARALGLDVLVEVHDRDELQRALGVGADIVGINNRDLRDFSVDVERTFCLMGELPKAVVSVSESGIATAEQLSRLEQAGVDAVLVGESLMRAPDPEAALRALRAEPTR
jgi:indole-3-glycerol phosphate synthase